MTRLYIRNTRTNQLELLVLDDVIDKILSALQESTRAEDNELVGLLMNDQMKILNANHQFRTLIKKILMEHSRFDLQNNHIKELFSLDNFASRKNALDIACVLMTRAKRQHAAQQPVDKPADDSLRKLQKRPTSLQNAHPEYIAAVYSQWNILQQNNEYEQFRQKQAAFTAALHVIAMLKNSKDICLIHDFADIEARLRKLLSHSDSKEANLIDEMLDTVARMQNASGHPAASSIKIHALVKKMIPVYRSLIRSKDELATTIQNFFRKELFINLPSNIKKGELLSFTSLLFDDKEKIRDQHFLPEFPAMINQKFSFFDNGFDNSLQSLQQQFYLRLIMYAELRSQEGNNRVSDFFKFKYLQGNEKIRLTNDLVKGIEAWGMMQSDWPANKIYKNREMKTLFNKRLGVLIKDYYKVETALLKEGDKSVLPPQLRTYLAKKSS